jgi:hypothetical protein
MESNQQPPSTNTQIEDDDEEFSVEVVKDLSV